MLLRAEQLTVLVVYRLTLVLQRQKKIQHRPDRIQQSEAEHHCFIPIRPMDESVQKRRDRKDASVPTASKSSSGIRPYHRAARGVSRIPEADSDSWPRQLSKSALRVTAAQIPTRHPPGQSVCGRGPTACLVARIAPRRPRPSPWPGVRREPIRPFTHHKGTGPPGGGGVSVLRSWLLGR